MAELRNITVRLSVTERCQLACSYCNPKGTRHASPAVLSPRSLVEIVASLHRSFSVGKVRFTGGEPLLLPELPKMIRDVIAMGIPDVGLTTNGQLLAGKVEALRAAGLQRINVSCDSFNEQVFRSLTGGSLERTLRGIQEAQKVGMRPIKLNMVVMRGRNNQEIADLLDFALRNSLELRFLELMPVGLSPQEFDSLYVPSSEIQQALGKNYRLTPCAEGCGATSRRFAVEGSDGASGYVGFISPQSHPFCSSCRRLRITSQGNMIGCLASQNPVSLCSAMSLSGPARDRKIAELAVLAFRGKRSATRYTAMAPMAAIGG